MDNISVGKAWNLVSEKLTTWFELGVKQLPNFVMAIVLLLVFWAVANIARRMFLRAVSKNVMHESLRQLTASVLKTAIIIGGFFIALGVLNLDKTVTSLLAGVGVVGLALGFAFQDIAANFVSGILIAFKRPFKIGDIVEIDGHSGVVKEIGFRKTEIITFDGIEILVPNKKLYTEPMKNFTDTKDRRLDLACGVSYGDDLDKVEKIVKGCLENLPGRIKDKDIEVMFNEFGGSSINFDARVWIEFEKQLDYVKARSESIKKIKKAFDENDISIPFPIRTLDFGIRGGENLATPLAKAFEQSEAEDSTVQ